jgi:hypothetical protein
MANINPIFIGTPVVQNTITNAASSRDGDGGTYNLLFTPGPNGSRIERVTAIVAGTAGSTTTAMAVRLYIKNVDDDDLYLYREALFPAVNPSNTIVGANVTFNFNGGLCLGTQSQLFAGTSVGDTGANRVSWIAEGGNF